MEERFVINPVTRISGFLEIQVEISGHTIVNARSSGLLFRGFEQMLKGRSPLDAIYFTERICGICSTAHAMASTLALEEALQVEPELNAQMLRDLIHAAEFLQNHLRHFYQYTLPDFIYGPEIHPLYPVAHRDFRLPEYLNREIAGHYLESTTFSRLAHEIIAILGGKAPHNHGIFVGGVTVNFDAAKWIKLKANLERIREFVVEKMLPDAAWLAEYYQDYFRKGRGYGNLLSYGLFPTYLTPQARYVEPGVLLAGMLYEFNPAEISENIYHAWYTGTNVTEAPPVENFTPDVTKPGGYSWIKAPRYAGYPVETGPLARMWLSDNYQNGISAMDRIIARVMEVKKIIQVMEALVEQIQPAPAQQKRYQIPVEAHGRGLLDTTRGALGHWLTIENQRIGHYEIVTPSVWNLSPEDAQGVKGVVEQALIGTEIDNLESPVEIGRIVRSFDPCVSCATHVVGAGHSPLEVQII